MNIKKKRRYKMTHTYLLEIGLEEMPANVILDASNQLKNRVSEFLKRERLAFDSINTFSTPRRLAVKINGLAEGQPDKKETIKGPAKKIAIDDEGNWTKAAIGFSKGQGASPDDIVFKDVKGEEYVFIEKKIKGKHTSEVLVEIVQEAKSINFPVSMKWGNSSERYIRPVHWLVSLLDTKIVSTEMFGVEASNKTFGHRFLGDEVTINHPDEYEEKLANEYVISDRDARQEMIKNQITELCEANEWALPLYNKELLEEVTDLVEYPTAFYGNFSSEFLEVPESVLETSMADHQRYFPVRSKGEEKFLPHFIGIRNGNKDYLDKVVQGNEKVLAARLEDAKFFYDEDKKVSISEFVEKLKGVTFQEKLGSLYDKQLRVYQIVQVLANQLNSSSAVRENVKRAASIYKFDLVTSVVDEFTDLQGVIGSIYAHEKGEPKEIAEAIEQQYMPKSLNGKLPYTETGIILSLAEKLDTLLTFFSIGLIPSGSNDPFALRRNALGIIRIIKEHYLTLPLRELVSEIMNELDVSEEIQLGFENHKEELFTFIRDRIDQQMKISDKSVPYDVRQGVLYSDQQDIVTMFDTAFVLTDAKAQSEYRLVGEALTRTANLAEKNDSGFVVDEDHFETESEAKLYSSIKKLEQVFANTKSAQKRYETLIEISPIISTFFDNNMVNTNYKELRENRYALLSRLHQITRNFADFSKLVIK